MKRKPLLLALVALLAACGLWLARSSSRAHLETDTPVKSSMEAALKTPEGPRDTGNTNPSTRLAPPDPTRVFREFTPEQRVEFARRGQGPGG